MTLEKIQDGSKLTVVINGRLDTNTVIEAEKELDGAFDDITELVWDFKGLDYISSAGLRVLLSAQKKMNTKGSMKVVGVNKSIMEIFEVTGFTDILTIE